MAHITFDEVLPTLATLLGTEFGKRFVEGGTILRDTAGRVKFVSAENCASEAVRERVEQSISNALGEYARPDQALIFADDFGASAILTSPDAMPMQIAGYFCNLVDRRIVGSGWLERPEIAMADPARIVFATLKGGVGRSTALSVTAADLARRGRNVLVVDLDLEAPGLGDLMLTSDRLPEFGAIDYLVDGAISRVDESDLDRYLGTSNLTAADGGRVDILPALGQTSIGNPENVLAKLSRAMIEEINEEGTISVGARISQMVERFCSLNNYDVVLIDSRAGLSELAAPAILGLGATVLLFGTAQKQTIEGYRSLFSALRLLAQRDRKQGRNADWRLLLKPVYAKSSLNQLLATKFADDFYELFSEYIYDEESEVEAPEDALRFSHLDYQAPHWPFTIPFNQGFVDFEPTNLPDQLTAPFYEQTFRPFLSDIDAIIELRKQQYEPE